MEKTITVQEAAVKTAQVSVKALTISGKQVTLAVFRQLRSEPLIETESLTLAGVPWGTVNYHCDGCADRDEHLHVVWQKDNELRRSYCVRDCPRHATANLYGDISGCFEQYLSHLALAGRLIREKPGYPFQSQYRWGKKINGYDCDFQTHYPEPLFLLSEPDHEPETYYDPSHLTTQREKRAYREQWEARVEKHASEDRAKIAQARADLLERFGIDEKNKIDPNRAYREVSEAVDALRLYRKQWEELYQSFRALDQLFIAV